MPTTPTMATHRKLVTLRKITKLRRLKGMHYKAYAVATVADGWTVVVYHGDFKVGDLVLYFEIDSFIPATTGRFGWEKESCLTTFQGRRGYHVVSQMLSRELSQGLIQPVAALPEVKAMLDALEREHGHDKAMAMAQGADMAFDDVLGVTKWEVPFEAKGRVLGSAPTFFPRPACERAQNSPDLFLGPRSSRSGDVFQITEKLDGVSMTAYRVALGSRWHRTLPALPDGLEQQEDGDVGKDGPGGARWGVASAVQDLDSRGGDVYWQTADRLGLPDMLKKMAGHNLPSLTVQGELVGPTVKNNSLGFDEGAEHQFLVFQIFDIERQKCLDPRVVVAMCGELGLPHVPVIGYLRLGEFAGGLSELLAKAEGLGFRGTTREGLVFKSMRDDGFAFKVISNKWLLEQGE